MPLKGRITNTALLWGAGPQQLNHSRKTADEAIPISRDRVKWDMIGRDARATAG